MLINNHKKMLDTIVELPISIEEKINLKSFLFIISELKPSLINLLTLFIINKKVVDSIIIYWWSDKYQKYFKFVENNYP